MPNIGSWTLYATANRGGALAALGSIGKEIASVKVGLVGVGLTLFVDGLKGLNGTGNLPKTALDVGMGIVGVFVPEIGLVYIVLDHFGVVDMMLDHTPKPSNYNNPVCPQDNTKTVIPNYSH